jgi:hypothetical protein
VNLPPSLAGGDFEALILQRPADRGRALWRSWGTGNERSYAIELTIPWGGEGCLGAAAPLPNN